MSRSQSRSGRRRRHKKHKLKTRLRRGMRETQDRTLRFAELVRDLLNTP